MALPVPTSNDQSTKGLDLPTDPTVELGNQASGIVPWSHGRSPVATNRLGLTLSARAATGRGPCLHSCQVISPVLQSEEISSFNSRSIQPIAAERVTRKYWPHRV